MRTTKSCDESCRVNGKSRAISVNHWHWYSIAALYQWDHTQSIIKQCLCVEPSTFWNHTTLSCDVNFHWMSTLVSRHHAHLCKYFWFLIRTDFIAEYFRKSSLNRKKPLRHSSAPNRRFNIRCVSHRHYVIKFLNKHESKAQSPFYISAQNCFVFIYVCSIDKWWASLCFVYSFIFFLQFHVRYDQRVFKEFLFVFSSHFDWNQPIVCVCVQIFMQSCEMYFWYVRPWLEVIYMKHHIVANICWIQAEFHYKFLQIVSVYFCLSLWILASNSKPTAN